MYIPCLLAMSERGDELPLTVSVAAALGIGLMAVLYFVIHMAVLSALRSHDKERRWADEKARRGTS